MSDLDRRGFLKGLAGLAGIGATAAMAGPAVAAVGGAAVANGGKVRGGRIELGSGGIIDGCDVEDASIVVQAGASRVLIANNVVTSRPRNGEAVTPST